MAPTMATKRLREELIKLKTEPPPGIIAEPDESNILKWFYVIRGPAETPFEGGVYIGKLIFPSEYPMRAPSVYMLTPSGRFQINTKICMSMSDFHPESWNPMWSVATIIQGVQSFMASDELTTGGLKASDADRKKYAKLSCGYNLKNYPNLFEGDIEAALHAASEACQKAEEENAKSSSSSNGQPSSSSRRSRRTAKKTGSIEQEKTEQDAEKSSNDQKFSLSRRSRRLAKKAVSTEQEQPNQDTDIINSSSVAQSIDVIETNHHKEQNSTTDASTNATTKQLSSEEIEKRRRRNAKKRAKQKAKKSGISTVEEIS